MANTNPSQPLKGPKEMFAQRCLTMTHAEAYRQTFPETCAGKTVKEIGNLAYMCARRNEARIKWLSSQVTERAVTSAVMRKREAWESLSVIARDVNQKIFARLDALDKILKIEGAYKGEDNSIKPFAIMVVGGAPFNSVQIRDAREALGIAQGDIQDV